ncbi:unnamed protein product [Symbiodinium natans]|uniref:Uncharacterized protein n=1 Tax=Symbiodinium natans TaxID=878477 RepID=A0A812PV73_9DINO|nr:unnamed protein product [Symbiodinium natans]
MNVKIAELLCRGPCCAEGSASTGWPRGHPRLLQGIRPAEAVWLGDLVRLRPPRHQLASFLKVPTSFEDEEEAASKAEEDEVPRPPDSPLNNLAKFRSKHARTQDGYLCAAAGVKDEQAFTGCTDLPAPDGTNIGRKWCYIEPSQVEAAGVVLSAGASCLLCFRFCFGGKEWGWCRALFSVDVCSVVLVVVSC